MRGKWSADQMPDLSGKLAIVTGANSGIGFETARHLAAHGAHTILACRDRGRGEQALAALLAADPRAPAELMSLDLADLSAVRGFVRAFRERHGRLDLLINNAGVAFPPERRTVDDFEAHYGVNHLGHFALTGSLIDLLVGSPAGRVVTVSSVVHWVGRIDLESRAPDHLLGRVRAYAMSKLANLLFCFELQRRLEAAGSPAISVAAHPGLAATGLLRNARLFRPVLGLSGQSGATGALAVLFAATAPAVQGGDYYGPRGWVGVRGYPAKVRASRQSRDPEAAECLWKASEELTGVRWSLAAPSI